MTATLPHNSHLAHQRYDPTPSLGSYHHSHSNGPTRLAVSHSFPQNKPSSSSQSTYASSRQLPPLGNMPSSNSNTQLQYRNKQERERKPDWDEFYKNGPPKEIIVIDDDDSPPPNKRKAPPTRKRPSPQARAGATQPTVKKRRTAYDSVRDYHGSYPKRTFSPGDSSSLGSERTNSLQTTAPTSLGSHTSRGSNGAYVEDVGVGSKRKRTTRGQIAAEKRRQEANAVVTYVPPPDPPIKAKDVHVPSLRDVS